ncbi:hypothetical protein [Streptomyces sp. NPDC049881]|uniref:hypothetical protein n=1 Tax=unclassified Streptomyces TaxID=2593676 RepID=UPI0034336ED0
MSFDEEWAALQAAAREEQARTRLNSEGTGGADALDLEVSENDLTPLRTDADGLADRVTQDGFLAQNITHVAGIFLRTPGLDTGYALIEVAERWESQANALRNALQRIAGHVGETVRAHAGDELETAAALEGARWHDPR